MDSREESQQIAIDLHSEKSTKKTRRVLIRPWLREYQSLRNALTKRSHVTLFFQLTNSKPERKRMINWIKILQESSIPVCFRECSELLSKITNKEDSKKKNLSRLLYNYLTERIGRKVSDVKKKNSHVVKHFLMNFWDRLINSQAKLSPKNVNLVVMRISSKGFSKEKVLSTKLL